MVPLRAADRLAASVLGLLVRAYQLALSPLLGSRCRFYPTCSEYSRQALKRHGAVFGSALTVKRIACCQPFHPGGVDLVPERPDLFARKPL